MIDYLNDIELCLTTLKEGGIILYPTDTIWGIGCDATNETAVDKIYKIKQRAEAKSMIILLAELRDIIHVVTEPDLAVFDFLQTVQKPTTIIYDGAIGLANNAVSTDGSIAIRVTKDPFCKHLIKRFKKPIVSTSANISGHASPSNFNSISAAIKNGVNYIVKHRQNEVENSISSAIIKWNKDGTSTIIRP